MQKGLDLFRTWFSHYADHYVLIGGTAASLAMQAAGRDFRQTKDLDIVLHVGALSADFVSALWDFVKAGGYAIRHADAATRPCLYRFQKPSDEDFPFMIELFCRAPDAVELIPGSQLTPLPAKEAISSLSAILLDSEYYEFILRHRSIVEGLPVITVAALIPLKALAWLNLSEARAAGAPVDSRDIRKHLSDIISLTGLLAPGAGIDAGEKIRGDLRRLVAAHLPAADSHRGLSLAMERLQAAYRL